MSEFGGALDNWLNRDNPWENEDDDEEYEDWEPDYEKIAADDYDYRNS